LVEALPAFRRLNRYDIVRRRSRLERTGRGDLNGAFSG
jgi:hypothetical protein